MCRQHLLGEHVEMHMLVGSLRKDISVQGFIDDGLIDLQLIRRRHSQLVDEMTRRGYNHKSPLPAYTCYINRYDVHGHINVEANVRELARRCEECLKLQMRGGHG